MPTPKNRSVRKAFTLLQSFRHSEEWVSGSELSRRANLPEASGYRLLVTLEEVGAVMRDEGGRCRPGLLLVSLSQKVAVNDCLRDAAEDVMEAMCRRLDVTAHLARLEDGMVFYVAKSDTPRSCAVQTVVGGQFEAYSSGLGKVLLATLSPDELDAFIDTGALVAFTAHTITDPALLKRELEQVRRSGFARDDREFRLDISCIAVPVLDGEGRTVAALSITEHPDRMTPARLAELRTALQEAAATISGIVYPVVPPLEARPRRQRAVAAVA